MHLTLQKTHLALLAYALLTVYLLVWWTAAASSSLLAVGRRARRRRRSLGMDAALTRAPNARITGSSTRHHHATPVD